MNRKSKQFYEVLESTFNTDILICFWDRHVAQIVENNYDT